MISATNLGSRICCKLRDSTTMSVIIDYRFVLIISTQQCETKKRAACINFEPHLHMPEAMSLKRLNGGGREA